MLLHINGYTQHQQHNRLSSEGIRGNGEIAFALAHHPSGQIVELLLDPVTRLQRLSKRNDTFDQITQNSQLDLSFLPEEYQALVQDHLSAGSITTSAINIMQAEAQNYGLTGYTGSHTNYHRLQIDHLAPIAIAQRIAHHLEEMNLHA